MARIIALILCMTLVVGACVVAVGSTFFGWDVFGWIAGTPDEETPHEHSYKMEVTPPTCTEGGYTTYTCSCEDFYVDNRTDATGHTYGEWVEDTPATEEAEGTKHRDCANCDAVENGTIPKLEHKHSYTSVVTPPTCTEGGYTTHTCSCEYSYVDNRTDATGHSYGEWVEDTPATEEAEGTKHRDCENCDAVENGTIPKLEHKHSYTSVVTPPTCTEGGYTTHTCSCEYSYVDSSTDATGHTYGEWEVDTPATEEAEGTKHRDCENCDAVENGTIPKLEHKHSYTPVVTAPTCTIAGYTTYTCTCGDSYKENGEAALGHEYDEGVITTKPGCETKGVKTFTCKRSGCDHSYNVDLEPTKHDYKDTIVPATCIAQGYTLYTCGNCGDSYKDNYTKLAEHSYNGGVVTTDPTCIKNGVKTFTCTVYGCGETRTEEVPANGHAEVQHAGQDATCTKDGWKAYVTCENCSYTTYEKINKTGHTGGKATCKSLAVCSECDNTYGNYDTVNGHDYGEADCDSPATCKLCGNESGPTIGHLDQNKDHVCDRENCTYEMGDHVDNNNDHVCDYGCEVAIGACEDKDLDHACDYGCKEVFGDHVDSDKDHACDYGCKVAIGVHKDGDDEGHTCDYGCSDPVEGEECVDENPKNHVCDECGGKVGGNCSDSNDRDHLCDYCGEKLEDCYGGNATCTDKAVCAECGNPHGELKPHVYDQSNKDAEGALKTSATCTTPAIYYYSCSCGEVDKSENAKIFEYGNALQHKDDNKDHTCDNGCGIYQGTHADGNDEDHLCDYDCGVTLSEHKYIPAVTYPTCTAGGYTTYTCACGDKYTDEETEMIPHSWDEGKITIPAGCETTGVKTFTCGSCGTTKTEDIKAKDHNYVAGAVTLPTCTEDGYTTYTCSGCGDTEERDKVFTNGHTEETVEGKDATCTEDGLTDGKKCSVCGNTLEEQEVIPASHSLENATAQASTCTTQGWNAYEYCTKCDYTTQVLLDLDSDNHTWVDNKCECGAKKVIKTETVTTEKEYVFELGTDKAAGDHSDGSGAGTYSETVNEITLNLADGSSMYKNAYDGLGNSCIKLGTGSKAGAFTITVPDNVTKVIITAGGYKATAGKLQYTVGSSDPETVTLAAMFDKDGIVHNGTDYTVFEIDTSTEKTISFTTVSGGYRAMLNSITFVASVEEEKEVEVIVTAHDCAEFVTDATCTENGICSKCGDEVADSATGHSYEEEVTDPTCEDAGYTTYTCDCGDTYTGNEVEATGHNYDETTHICANCGETDPDACFHTNEREEVTAPTCTTGGYTTYYCADCGEVLRTGDETAPAHSYESAVTAPTCTDDGFTIYTCSACGDTYTDDEVPANGHTGYAQDYKCDTCSAVVEPTTDTLTIEQAIALGQAFAHDTESVNSYYVTGVVYDVHNTTYGNMYLVNSFVDKEAQFQIYGLYLEDDTRYDAMTTKPVAGDTITIYGKIGNYSGKSQMADATLNNLVQHGDNHQWSVATCLVPSICSICGAKGEKADHVDANDDKVCDVDGCGAPVGVATKEVWKLVTNLNQLGVDDEIVIVVNTSSYKYAISTAQKSNNRGATTITVSSDGSTISFADNSDVQIITLREGYNSGTYAFDVGTGYLYAASSSGNQLKTKSSIDVNGSWDISFDSNGNTIVKAINSSNRNELLFNYNNGSPLFACYSGKTNNYSYVSIYVKTTEAVDDNDEPSHTTHTVTFKDGENTVDTKTVTSGEKVSAPEISKDGYTFLGWFHGNTPWDFDNDTVTGDITLTAKWEEISSGGDGPATPSEPSKLATFEMGTATSDSSSAMSEYTETDGQYTLEISGSYMYKGYGNGDSAIKFGKSSSGKGEGSFTVATNVTKVVIYVSQYSGSSEKDTITINGTTYTISTTYQAIEIEQPTADAEWTVSISANVASKNRFYVGTIEFFGYAE